MRFNVEIFWHILIHWNINERSIELKYIRSSSLQWMQKQIISEVSWINSLLNSFSLGYLRNAHTTNNNENDNKNEYIYDSAPIFPFFLLSHLLCLIHCWTWHCSCILLSKRRANHLVRNHSISRLVYAH